MPKVVGGGGDACLWGLRWCLPEGVCGGACQRAVVIAMLA